MGWSSKSPATQRWDGKGAPGDEDSVVDLSSGQAWAVAAPTTQSPAGYTSATIRASAASHPCPATPQNQPDDHGRRSTRPAADHAVPAGERLPGGGSDHRPPWDRLPVRIPEPVGERQPEGRPHRLPRIPGRHPVLAVSAHQRRPCPPTMPPGGRTAALPRRNARTQTSRHMTRPGAGQGLPLLGKGRSLPEPSANRFQTPVGYACQSPQN